MLPDPQVGERWLANGLFPDEEPAMVTITEAVAEDVCVDCLYDNGVERLLPRQCMVRRIAEAPKPDEEN
ncbi:hypothetical protein N9917_00205 [Deltaproteobacteria bacterium]|nr:hypothetical protein [Deltaproteobacteria bacterium]